METRVLEKTEAKKIRTFPELTEAIVKSKLDCVKNAQAAYSRYPQEHVDKIFFAADMAANKARISLAKMAAEETSMGIVEDKVIVCRNYR